MMAVLLDVVDPEKNKKLDDGGEHEDIWHDDEDGGDNDGMSCQVANSNDLLHTGILLMHMPHVLFLRLFCIRTTRD